ncbi:MAG: protein phosphatase 2C domain-containing protein, partial [Nocardioides sp.]
MLRFHYGAVSHVGLVRPGNEDAGFASHHVQVVADGVGGAAAGEVAAATTAYVVSALAAAHPSAESDGLLRRAVREAHDQLRYGVAADPERSGMATTLTAALARHGQVTLLHVGDSRAYLMSSGRLRRLTTDHTFVQSMIDAGRLTSAEARTHPYRSVVLRSVNADELPDPDVFRVDVTPGDRLLLCSDGLTDFVDETEIAARLPGGHPDDAAQRLVDAALAAGGRDNVTCLVSDIDDGPPHGPGRPRARGDGEPVAGRGRRRGPRDRLRRADSAPSGTRGSAHLQTDAPLSRLVMPALVSPDRVVEIGLLLATLLGYPRNEQTSLRRWHIPTHGIGHEADDPRVWLDVLLTQEHPEVRPGDWSATLHRAVGRLG